MEPKSLHEGTGYNAPNTSSGDKGDAYLWHLARRRASFKSHFATYLAISAFFWVLWYATGGGTQRSGLPWPVWPMLGWGIGVAFHYIGAYIAPRSNAVEKEYQKLKQQQNNANL